MKIKNRLKNKILNLDLIIKGLLNIKNINTNYFCFLIFDSFNEFIEGLEDNRIYTIIINAGILDNHDLLVFYLRLYLFIINLI